MSSNVKFESFFNIRILEKQTKQKKTKTIIENATS